MKAQKPKLPNQTHIQPDFKPTVKPTSFNIKEDKTPDILPLSIKTTSSELDQFLQDSHFLGGTDYVDHKYHSVETQKLPPFLRNLKAFKPAANIPKSAKLSSSAKVLLDMQPVLKDHPLRSSVGEYVMLKPYHHKPHYGYYLPIFGWATMTTKDIFNAAGLDDHIENVYTTVHNNIPVVKHVFAAPQYETLSSLLNRNVVPKVKNVEPILKIGILDFLTGNTDRHGHNILFHKDTFQPIAIDHEKNFQYIGKRHDSISSFLSVLNPKNVILGHNVIDVEQPIMVNKELHPEYLQKLKDWWLSHGLKIKKAFELNVSAIKNPKIRRFIKKNFNTRWQLIDDWAKRYSNKDLFNKDFIKIKTTPFYKHFKRLKNIPKAYQKNPVEAIQFISDEIEANPNIQPMVFNLLEDFSQKLTPEQLGDLFLTNYNKSWPVDKILLWRHSPSKRVQILKHIEKKLEKLGEPAKKQIPMVWALIEEMKKHPDNPEAVFELEQTKPAE